MIRSTIIKFYFDNFNQNNANYNYISITFFHSSKNTVLVRFIGTPSKYEQRKIDRKNKSAVNPFDLFS